MTLDTRGARAYTLSWSDRLQLSILVLGGFCMQRNAFIWAFSALFGCISLFGQGWHALVGHDLHSHAHHGACASNCSPHDHETGNHETDDRDPLAPFSCSHAPCESAKLAPSGQQLVDDHDCPICSFFAQSSHVSLRVIASNPLVSCELSSRPATVHRATVRGSYRPRAPPTSAEIG